jgi:hypothetical protein
MAHYPQTTSTSPVPYAYRAVWTNRCVNDRDYRQFAAVRPYVRFLHFSAKLRSLEWTWLLAYISSALIDRLGQYWWGGVKKWEGCSWRPWCWTCLGGKGLPTLGFYSWFSGFGLSPLVIPDYLDRWGCLGGVRAFFSTNCCLIYFSFI